MTAVGHAIGARCARDGQTFAMKVRVQQARGWEAYDAVPTASALTGSSSDTAINAIPTQGRSYPGCPHCKAKSYFVCYTCNGITCWDGSADRVRCTACGIDVTLGAAQPVNLRRSVAVSMRGRPW